MGSLVGLAGDLRALAPSWTGQGEEAQGEGLGAGWLDTAAARPAHSRARDQGQRQQIDGQSGWAGGVSGAEVEVGGAEQIEWAGLADGLVAALLPGPSPLAASVRMLGRAAQPCERSPTPGPPLRVTESAPDRSPGAVS